jgi:hypothetical protein
MSRIYFALIFFICFFVIQISYAANEKKSLIDSDIIRADIKKLFELSQKQSGIGKNNKFDLFVEFKERFDNKNEVSFKCRTNEYRFLVSSSSNEQVSSVYYAVRRLGFLFPHPRMTLAPDFSEIVQNCNRTWIWKPVLRDRGFHLHTQHAGEWVDGFFMGNQKIAEDTIWWLARNQQNLLQLQTLRIDEDYLAGYLNPLIGLSHQLGIRFGLSFGFAMFQQNNFYLIPIWRAVLGLQDEEILRQRLKNLIQKINFDYATSELGTTEFTPIDYERSIRWMNIASEELAKAGRQYYIKSHVSSNQRSPKYGNFNFLPQYANPETGVLAHTVFFYGLKDNYTPVYGRKDFTDMVQFMLSEKNKRKVWYFPETSYYIAMDIDIPLLLTDYLIARAEDMKFLSDHGFEGQVNFSTGQELGYWLFDWTICLLNDQNFHFDPLIAIKLLGEDIPTWKSLLDWQTKYIKQKQTIQQLSAANFMDEFAPLLHLVHERKLFRQLLQKRETLEAEIQTLSEALLARPSIEKIKIEELKILIELTYMRMEQAFYLRKALLAQINEEDDSEKIHRAEQITTRGLKLMDLIEERHNRYPESFVFKQHKNPSSYQYGYGWPAKTLHFWQREQLQIKKKSYWNPLFLNIYNPLDILF